MEQVDFIIPGAMKAGTSALAYFLGEHPAIAMPRREVRFFSENYERGLNWYFDTLSQLEKATKAGVRVGDKTVNYAYFPQIPQRIARHFPQVKFIWLFRDPIKRMVSQYKQYYGFGKEWLPFEPAIRSGEARSKRIEGLNYLDLSTYHLQVRRYLDCFERSRMLFLLAEDLRVKPHDLLRTVCAFIGVDDTFKFTFPDTRREVNASDSRPVFPQLQQFSWHYIRPESRGLHQRIIRYNRLKSELPVALTPEFEEELRAYFRPHNQHLAQLTGLDLSVWGS